VIGSAFRKAKYEIRRRRKARAGKNSFPPTPFLFARPSVQCGARSAPSVPFKIGSDFVKQTHQDTTPLELTLLKISEKIQSLRPAADDGGSFGAPPIFTCSPKNHQKLKH